MSSSRPFLLDTNVTGYIVSGRSPRARKILEETLPHTPVLISSVTEAEVRYGLELKPEAVRLRASVGRLFQALEIRSWGSAEAEAYSRLRVRLRAIGKALSHPDLMIAAHAIAIDATLVSHDRAFENAAPYLAVLDWATDHP